MALQRIHDAGRRRLKLEALALAAIALVLALICVWLANAWRVEHERAACWRTLAEGQTPPEGRCR